MCKICAHNGGDANAQHTHNLGAEGQSWIDKLTKGAVPPASQMAEQPKFAGHPGKKF